MKKLLGAVLAAALYSTAALACQEEATTAQKPQQKPAVAAKNGKKARSVETAKKAQAPKAEKKS